MKYFYLLPLIFVIAITFFKKFTIGTHLNPNLLWSILFVYFVYEVIFFLILLGALDILMLKLILVSIGEKNTIC